MLLLVKVSDVLHDVWVWFELVVEFDLMRNVGFSPEFRLDSLLQYDGRLGGSVSSSEDGAT